MTESLWVDVGCVLEGTLEDALRDTSLVLRVARVVVFIREGTPNFSNAFAGERWRVRVDRNIGSSKGIFEGTLIEKLPDLAEPPAEAP